MVVKYTYDAWGKVLNVTGDENLKDTLGEIQPFRYRGYVYDVETEFYYLRNRYYDSYYDRFLNTDSIIDYVRLLETNGYVYCKNNPIWYKDPNGSSIISYLITFALFVAAASVVSAIKTNRKASQNSVKRSSTKQQNKKLVIDYYSKRFVLVEDVVPQTFISANGEALTGNRLEMLKNKIGDLRGEVEYISDPRIIGNIAKVRISYSTGPFWEQHVHIESVVAEFGEVTKPTYIQIFKDACTFLGEINCPLIPEVQLIGNIAQVASFVISITERIGDPFPAYYNSYEIINIQITPER